MVLFCNFFGIMSERPRALQLLLKMLRCGRALPVFVCLYLWNFVFIILGALRKMVEASFASDNIFCILPAAHGRHARHSGAVMLLHLKFHADTYLLSL